MIKHNRMLGDHVVSDASDLNRTRKIYAALEEICKEFDLGIPIWLDSNISEFKRISKTRFTKDSFMEDIPFDYLEIQILEEDI